MKTTKLILIALVFAAMAASSAVAQRVTRSTARPSMARPTNVARSHFAQRMTRTPVQPSFARSRTSVAPSRTFARSQWNHQRHYRSRSNVFFNFGYPYYGYGWGYPYYDDYYPYGYGYYAPYTQRYTVYDRGITDDATVAAVQQRLARGGYYHGTVDGVIGPGTRTAIRAFERNNGLPVDGVIDTQLLRTMGLA